MVVVQEEEVRSRDDRPRLLYGGEGEVPGGVSGGVPGYFMVVRVWWVWEGGPMEWGVDTGVGISRSGSFISWMLWGGAGPGGRPPW